MFHVIKHLTTGSQTYHNTGLTSKRVFEKPVKYSKRLLLTGKPVSFRIKPTFSSDNCTFELNIKKKTIHKGILYKAMQKNTLQKF